jgi:hypothetical protein
MTSSHQDVPPCQWFSRLAAFLDRRSAAKAGLAVPRSGLCPRAEDCHKLDPRRWPEHPISTLLHDGRGRRSPWDNPNRRPSHVDKRRAWRRELLAEEIRAVLRPGVTKVEIQAVAERLLSLAA